MRLIVARCEVSYVGRLTTVLPQAVRLLMLKPDGTFMVWADGGGPNVKPLNWMIPPTVIEEQAGADGRLRRLLVRKQRQEDRLEIQITQVLSDIEHELDVSTATVHRWLREGFITGEQITPGAPWQIRLTDELRGRVCEHSPDGWLPLTDAAKELGVARQTVLHKVQRGELRAIQVTNGRRKGLRIEVPEASLDRLINE